MALDAPLPLPPLTMTQYGRPRQISPLSTDTDNSSLLSRYGNMTPGESPYSATSMRHPMHPSPHRVQHQSASTDASSQRGSNRSPTDSQNGHYSSNSSVAPSSNGLDSPVFSETGRAFSSKQEETLQEHHNVLRRFLASEIARDAGARTARAKDKLIRLSPTQYLELSTDVYDEFRRREDDRSRRGQGVPRHLPPRNDFHPKRNQARQKLSHLSPDRFKQLATDAFFELERRLPRLAGDNIGPRTSPAGSLLNPQNVPHRAGTPSSMRGPSSPLPPGMYRGPGPGPGMYPGHPRSASSASNDHRGPMPQTFQNGNIVPHKGTMVEEDDSPYEARGPGLRVNTRWHAPSSGGSPLSAQPNSAFPPLVAELQMKLANLEEQLRAKTAEVEKMLAAKASQETAVERERQEWEATKQELEQQIVQEQKGRKDADKSRAKMYEQHMESQAELRDQMDNNVSTLQAQVEELTRQNETLLSKSETQPSQAVDDEWRDRCQRLRDRLAEQEEVTEQVRRDAAQFLQEMRALSDQSDMGGEREEQLQVQISDLRDEIQDWKDKYAKTKTLLRTMKASSVGLSSLQNPTTGTGSLMRPDFLSPDGAVKDIEVTNFQMSIDELLISARHSSADSTLDKMKGIIQLVQHMTADSNKSPASLSAIISPGIMSPASPHTPGNDPRMSSARVRTTKAARDLISTTRTFVSANGLAPVSLVDAAAANLTAAVIEFLKLAGIRASPASELHSGDNRPDARSRDSGLAASVPSVSIPVPSKGEQSPVESEPRSESRPGSGTLSPPMEAAAIRGPGGWFDRLKGSFESSYTDENSLASPRSDKFR